MKGIRLLFAAAIVLATLFCTKARAFDISAYYDPVGLIANDWFRGNYFYSLCDSLTLHQIQDNVVGNDDILRWYDKMGITILCTSYDTPSRFQNVSNYHFRVMNNIYLNGSYRYLEAQERHFRLAYQQDGYTIPNTITGSYGRYTTVAEVPISEGFSANVLTYAAVDTADTLWRPAASFGKWWGWEREDGRADPMPIGVTITAKVDNPGNDTVVAKLYWFGQMHEWVDQNMWNDSARWVRFGPVEIRNHDFDSSALYFNQHTYWLHPSSLTYFTDENPNSDSTGLWGPKNSVGNDNSAYVHWRDFEYRFLITTTGKRSFSVYDLQAFDSAYYEMFILPDPYGHKADSIANLFKTPMEPGTSNMAGWYYDEIHNEYAEAWVKMNRILLDHRMPTCWINGFAFDDNRRTQMDDLYDLFHQYGDIRPQCFMNETYIFLGDSENVTHSWYYPPFFYTRESSDGPYLDSTFIEETSILRKYDGTQSLQRAIDWTYWEPPSGQLFPVLSQNQRDSVHLIEVYPGFIDQVQLQHERGTKLWALLQAGAAGGVIDGGVMGHWRDPRPEEIKLEAWMAVASDADGIMYYYGMPTGPRSCETGTWGLFEWNGTNFCGYHTMSAETTGRYWAAAHVDSEILRIAPIIEPLEFLGTCGSRVFEQDYSSQDTSMRLHLGGVRSYGYAPMVEDFRTWSWQNDTTGEQKNHSFVQLSAWQSSGTRDDDYWFLVVNRRAMAEESCKVRVFLTGITPDRGYLVTRFLAQTESPAIPDTHSTQFREYHQAFDVVLGPGDAELVHFTPANDIVIKGGDADTLYTPLYLNRNIRVVDGSLTIMPWPGDPASTDTVRRSPDTTGVVVFWPGKGIILDTAAWRWDFSKLSIVGTHNTPVKFRSVYANRAWSGIQVRKGWADTLLLKNVEIAGAQNGLLVEGSALNTPDVNLKVSVDSCIFEACSTGVLLTTNASAEVGHSFVTGNGVGILCQVNSQLNLFYSQVENNRHFGINIVSGGGVNCDTVTIQGNGTCPAVDAGINVTLSRVALSCCEVKNNHARGICANRSTVIMAGRSDSISWGGNDIEHNTQPSLYRASEIYVGPGSLLSLDNGRNKIVGSGITWIEAPKISNCQPVYWTHNYWSGDDDEVLRHLPHGVVISPSLTSWQACETIVEPPSGGDEAEYISALSDFVKQQYQSAKSGFMNTVTMAPDCPVTRAAIRDILSADVSSGDPSSSLQYFTAVADTSSAPATARSATDAKAWSLAYVGNPDSAQAIFESMLNSAHDYSEEAEAHLELLALELVRQNLDTNDVVTPEELQTIADSMDYWHKWLATDLNITLKQGDVAHYCGDSTTISAAIYPFNELISIADDSITEVGIKFRCLPDSANWTAYQTNTASMDSMYHWQVPVGRLGGFINYIFWAKDAHGRFATSPMGADTANPDSGNTHFLSIEIGADTIRYPDSVVVWAPATITHDVHVIDGGVLVFKPYPGVEDHTIRIGDSVWLEAAGNSDTLDENDPADYAKIYLLGTEQEPITVAPLMTSAGGDSAAWGGIYINMLSNFFAKHTLFRTGFYSLSVYGPSWVNDPDHPGIAIDSCVFDSSATTLLISSYDQVDSVSYIRHTEFRRLGMQSTEEYAGGLMICEGQIQMSDCRIHDNAREGLVLANCGHSTFERVKVDHNRGPGMVAMLGYWSDPRFSCCEFSFNGDSTPEVFGKYGIHLPFANQSNCIFMDSVGPLIKFVNGDYIDLLDGGNGLYLLGGTGKYIVRPTPGSNVRDISGNYWYPVGPDSSAFLSFLTPDSAQYWNYDTQLDSFAACEGMEAGLPTAMAPRMGVGDIVAPTSSVNPAPTMATIGRQTIEHAQARQDLKQAQGWEKTGNHIAAASKFQSLLSKLTNTDVTAEALSGYFMAARRSGVKTGLSSYYATLRQQLPTNALQRQAQWLELKSLELEGQPQQALHGYEEIISRPENKADSVMAIISATRLHCLQAQKKKPELSSIYPQHRVTHVAELARRSFKLVRSLYGDDKLEGNVSHAAPIPKTYKLYQNYPNPFNPVTEIRFDLPVKTRVELRIFNILGQQVTTLVDEVRTAGAYHILWDGKSAGGAPVASGMYIYQLKCDKFVDAKKMILLR
jgi:hypothetical protein